MDVADAICSTQLCTNRGDAVMLTGNQITEIPPSIANLTVLKFLNISYNKLSDLPPEFYCLTGLIRLDISCNQFKEISKSVGELKNLKEFKVDRNELTDLPDTLANIPYVSENRF
jgi:Leucine-rich repeat (LRR) protein